MIDCFLLPIYGFIVADSSTEITFAGSGSTGFDVRNNGCLDVQSTVVTRPGFSTVSFLLNVFKGLLAHFVYGVFIVELCQSFGGTFYAQAFLAQLLKIPRIFEGFLSDFVMCGADNNLVTYGRIFGSAIFIVAFEIAVLSCFVYVVAKCRK